MKEKNEKEIVSFLIDRLIKECANSKGYVGVEYDNVHANPEEGITLVEDFFDTVMRELVVMEGNPDEYIQSEYHEDAPFRTGLNVHQHMIRLGRFVRKYAKIYLPEERADEFIEEVGKYIKV